MRNQKIILLFLNRSYVVGTRKNRLNELVLLSTQTCVFIKLPNKKIFTILRLKCLSGRMGNEKYLLKKIYDEVKENMFDMSSMRNKKRSKKNIISNPYVSC